jgi:hypothetical protein
MYFFSCLYANVPNFHRHNGPTALGRSDFVSDETNSPTFLPRAGAQSAEGAFGDAELSVNQTGIPHHSKE